MLTILIVLSFGFLMLAIHPFTTYPLSLHVVRFLRRFSHPCKKVPYGKPADPARRAFAICMCAYNEEKVIERKMRNLLALREREPGTEILVYVDAATDNTARLIEPYADRIRLHVSNERHGKTYGMNLLVQQATAPVVIFTDANVTLDEQALQNLRPYFSQPEIGCVCGNLVYVNDGDSVTAASGSAYWTFEQCIKKLEQTSGSVMGADGSLFAIRRSLHCAPPEDLIDDLYVSLMILCQGYRIVQADDVTGYELSVTSSKEEFFRKVRIACQGFNVHCQLWPRIKALDPLTIYKYLSHKVIRWFTIYSLVMSLICLVAAICVANAPMLAITLVSAVIFCCALGYWSAIRPFNQIMDMLIALGGTGIGVWQAMRGKRYQIWTPAASVRRP